MLLGVSGNGSVLPLASRDTLEWVQHTRFGLSLLTLLPTSTGCNPDFEEVRNKTRLWHLQDSSTPQCCCSAWTEVISSGPLIINLITVFQGRWFLQAYLAYGSLCMMRNGVSRTMLNDPQSGKSWAFDLIQTKNNFANEPLKSYNTHFKMLSTWF